VIDRPYAESRPLVPEWPEELDLTPKEVLNLLVDLNGRWSGKFNNVVDAMHLAIDQVWQDK